MPRALKDDKEGAGLVKTDVHDVSRIVEKVKLRNFLTPATESEKNLESAGIQQEKKFKHDRFRLRYDLHKRSNMALLCLWFA